MKPDRRPLGIAARFFWGDDPYVLAQERCDRVHPMRAVPEPCRVCYAAIYAAIRRDHARRTKGKR